MLRHAIGLGHGGGLDNRLVDLSPPSKAGVNYAIGFFRGNSTILLDDLLDNLFDYEIDRVGLVGGE